MILEPQGVRFEPGEILVCPATNPGWPRLFLTASGLVLEIGRSVVALEYGSPAVVGVKNATTPFQTGQRIRVDGSRGSVILSCGKSVFKRARSAAERNHITNLEFCHGYTEELSVADSEVDVILMAVCHIFNVTDSLFCSMVA